MKKATRPTWIPVVAAMMVKDGQVLLGQRPEGSSLAGIWEFPGGKIEPGEDPLDALKRELSEELGVQAQVGPLKLSTSHNYGEVNILLLMFEVNYWKGEPRNLHHTELKWVPFDKITDYPLPDANKKIVNQLFK